jgi:hypothetical protein
MQQITFLTEVMSQGFSGEKNAMTLKQFVKPAGAIAVFAAIVLAGMWSSSPRTRAIADDNDSNESKIQRGFEIAPVPLNLDGKDRELVGLGSYIVNAQADCDGCHSAGPPTEFVRGGNPYFGQPEKINPATYLGGGRNFGKISGPPSPDIISRNLTPDRTGLPEGGHTFTEFLQIIRAGKDFDHLHPNCSATVTTNCFPPMPPFDGDLLQIMPWPIYKNMTEHDLRAIYEYLSAIPCIEGPADPNDPRHNDCG